MPVVGQSIRRVDARGKVTGETLYPGDINLPDQVMMKVLFAGRPHARIRGIDTSAAEEFPGVLAVFTAKDVPVNEYGLILPDQPVLCGPGSSKPYVDRVRFVGDQVAVVVADTEPIAAEALRRIVVDYEDLPAVSDPLAAMAPDAPLLHPERDSNVFCRYRIRKGDVEKALAEADIVVQGEYRTLAQRGILRPVKIIWSREESILGHHKRHPYLIRAKWGATREGKVVAADMEVIADGGAYAYTSTKVLGNATLMCTGPYEIPNVKVDSCAVYTNHIPGGAFRGFGGPQGAFAAESQMNKLAEALGMDPVEIRMRNVLTEGALLSVGTPLPEGVSLGKVVEECARNAGWSKGLEGWRRPQPASLGTPAEPYFRRGLGFACAFKNVGFSFGAPESSSATIELHGAAQIEKVVLHHAGADVGQGAHTVMAQMAAEAVGVPIEKVRLVVSDTASSDNSGSASASRMTFMAGNSIRGAAEAALAKWNSEERPAVAAYQYRPPRTTPLDPATGQAVPNFAYGYVAEAVTLEVDVETGQSHVLRVVCADDVGKAVNPQLVEGQIEGAVVQAAGYALLEDFQQEGGQVRTAHLSTYLIPTIVDIPDEVVSVILEYPDPIGPWGARGMGEMPYLPLTPAVTAAVHDAVGIWFDEFPLTPPRVVRALRQAGRR